MRRRVCGIVYERRFLGKRPEIRIEENTRTFSRIPRKAVPAFPEQSVSLSPNELDELWLDEKAGIDSEKKEKS